VKRGTLTIKKCLKIRKTIKSIPLKTSSSKPRGVKGKGEERDQESKSGRVEGRKYGAG